MANCSCGECTTTTRIITVPANNPDTFGTVAPAGAALTTTNGVDVAAGDPVVSFPDGTTWAGPEPCPTPVDRVVIDTTAATAGAGRVDFPTPGTGTVNGADGSAPIPIADIQAWIDGNVDYSTAYTSTPTVLDLDDADLSGGQANAAFIEFMVQGPAVVSWSAVTEGFGRIEVDECDCGTFSIADEIHAAPAPTAATVTANLPAGIHRVRFTNVDVAGSASNWTYSGDAVDVFVPGTGLSVTTEPVYVDCDGNYWTDSAGTVPVVGQVLTATEFGCPMPTAVKVSDLVGPIFNVTAGPTTDPADDADGSATVNAGETLHFVSSDDSIEFTVTEGSAIVDAETGQTVETGCATPASFASALQGVRQGTSNLWDLPGGIVFDAGNHGLQNIDPGFGILFQDNLSAEPMSVTFPAPVTNVVVQLNDVDGFAENVQNWTADGAAVTPTLGTGAISNGSGLYATTPNNGTGSFIFPGPLTEIAWESTLLGGGARFIGVESDAEPFEAYAYQRPDGTEEVRDRTTDAVVPGATMTPCPIDVGQLPPEALADTAGTVTINNLAATTTTNGVVVPAGSEFIQFPDGTTWAASGGGSTTCDITIEENEVVPALAADGDVSLSFTIPVPAATTVPFVLQGTVPAGGSYVSLQVGTAPGLADVLDEDANGFTTQDVSSAGSGSGSVTFPAAGTYHYRLIRSGSAGGATGPISVDLGPTTVTVPICDRIDQLQEQVDALADDPASTEVGNLIIEGDDGEEYALSLQSEVCYREVLDVPVAGSSFTISNDPGGPAVSASAFDGVGAHFQPDLLFDLNELPFGARLKSITIGDYRQGNNTSNPVAQYRGQNSNGSTPADHGNGPGAPVPLIFATSVLITATDPLTSSATQNNHLDEKVGLGAPFIASLTGGQSDSVNPLAPAGWAGVFEFELSEINEYVVRTYSDGETTKLVYFDDAGDPVELASIPAGWEVCPEAGLNPTETAEVQALLDAQPETRTVLVDETCYTADPVFVPFDNYANGTPLPNAAPFNADACFDYVISTEAFDPNTGASVAVNDLAEIRRRQGADFSLRTPGVAENLRRVNTLKFNRPIHVRVGPQVNNNDGFAWEVSSVGWDTAGTDWVLTAGTVPGVVAASGKELRPANGTGFPALHASTVDWGTAESFTDEISYTSWNREGFAVQIAIPQTVTARTFRDLDTGTVRHYWSVDGSDVQTEFDGTPLANWSVKCEADATAVNVDDFGGQFPPEVVTVEDALAFLAGAGSTPAARYAGRAGFSSNDGGGTGALLTPDAGQISTAGSGFSATFWAPFTAAGGVKPGYIYRAHIHGLAQPGQSGSLGVAETGATGTIYGSIPVVADAPFSGEILFEAVDGSSLVFAVESGTINVLAGSTFVSFEEIGPA